MIENNVKLPKQWSEYLRRQPETGMDYQVVALTLRDGTKIDDVAVIRCHIIGEIREIGIIREEKDIPFDPNDIVNIEVTHRKWRFRR
jgi:hypothetical protein